MKRFFRSAAFPILVVVVLAFFAQRLINPGEPTKQPTYNEFLAQADSGKLKSVVFNTKDNTIDVVEQNGDEYSTGYPNNVEQSLLNQLEANDVSIEVKGTGGSSLLSLLTYVLPFLLFFGPCKRHFCPSIVCCGI